jgi:heme/copper-type cytochrome/quinol oxidase subunit 2
MDNNPSDKISPNRKVKNQQFWQIWMPIIVTVIICLAVLVIVVITAATGGANVSKMADVAIIVLAVPVLGTLFVSFILLFLVNHSLGSFYDKLPAFFVKSQRTVATIAARIQSIAMLLTIPLIKARSIGSGTKTFFDSTTARLRNRRINE